MASELDPRNWLLIGASGGVGRATLQAFEPLRRHYDQLTIMDPNLGILTDNFINFDTLGIKGNLIQDALTLPNDRRALSRLLRKRQIGTVIDLAMETLPMIELMQQMGIRYLNTGLIDENKDLTAGFREVLELRTRVQESPAILFSGANPGLVNYLANRMILRHGLPTRIDLLEYDSSRALDSLDPPTLPWSPKEYGVEALKEVGGEVGVNGQIIKADRPAIERLFDISDQLRPVLLTDGSIPACKMLHEEVASLGDKFRIPVCFYYALYPPTTKHIQGLYQQGRRDLTTKDLRRGDNVQTPLQGSDFITVRLTYDQQLIFSSFEIDNQKIVGTNATYYEVATGVVAGLASLAQDRLQPKIYFTEDLPLGKYWQVATSRLRFSSKSVPLDSTT